MRHGPTHMQPERIWVDSDGKGGWKRPSGKGERLIIIHAGSQAGWIPQCGKCFKSRTKSDDYHDEMNAQHFLEWFEYSLMPNVPNNSLIIIDNAKYHNTVVERVPTKSSTKKAMMEWLQNHGIPFDPKDLKRDLFKLIKLSNIKAVYKTDIIANKYGHEVVRLPIAHCELNPIEMAWASMKSYIRRNNKSFTLKEAESLVEAGFEEVTAEMWRKMCQHVKKIEDKYWEQDGLIEEAVEEFILRIGDEDDDSDNDDGCIHDDYTGNCTDDTDTDLSDDEHDRELIEEERRKLHGELLHES